MVGRLVYADGVETARLVQHHLISVFQPILPCLLLVPWLLANILVLGLLLVAPRLATILLALATPGTRVVLLDRCHMVRPIPLVLVVFSSLASVIRAVAAPGYTSTFSGQVSFAWLHQCRLGRVTQGITICHLH